MHAIVADLLLSFVSGGAATSSFLDTVAAARTFDVAAAAATLATLAALAAFLAAAAADDAADDADAMTAIFTTDNAADAQLSAIEAAAYADTNALFQLLQ
jgi:hypothetical protein